jgi:cytochrome c554/c'-like protein
MYAKDAGVLHAHVQLKFHNGRYIYKITMNAGKAELLVTDGSNTLSAPLLWAFGAGEVGQSYLFQRNGNYFESSVSYFSALENLDFTPARALLSPYSLEEAMARPVDLGEIRRCFSCHSTASVIAGKFEPSKLVAGITCEACHGPGEKHAAAMQAGVLQEGIGDEQAANLIFDPGKLDPDDSVDFCGACHGTWVDAVRAGIKGLPSVRLQPYRLQNSKCWGKGDPRITCVACHDPHIALVEELSTYDEKCLKCHLATPGSKSVSNHPGAACPVSTKDCASCHMPKIEVPVMHRAFVDHQIRIVRPDHALPD